MRERPLKGSLATLHLEKNGEENNEKSVDEEDFGKEWFCPVYGWKL
jgi:hypothetical protein